MKLLKIFRPLGEAFEWFGKVYLRRMFRRTLKALVGGLHELALNSVVIVASTLPDLDDEQKRKEAVKMLKQAAKRRGKELKDSIANAAIEIALQELKLKGVL